MNRRSEPRGPSPRPTPPDLRALRRRLFSWYARAKRDLPWRRDRDPYRIWVSEIMLQQTRVAVVIPRYRDFLRRFPSIRALARASEREALAAWSGLGYYARARNLHRAARELLARHGGRFPLTEEEIAALPGVGPYTAGAIASIAFDHARPAVDGNTIRVLARIGAIEGAARSAPLRAAVERIAASLVAPGRASDVNQALMDLGATVCLPRNPACALCPVERLCLARRTGRVSEFPAAARRPAPRHARLLLLVLARGRSALALTARRGLFRGLFLLPAFPLGDDEAPGRRALLEVRRRGFRPSGPPEALARFRHSVLAHRLSVTAIRVRVADRPKAPGPAGTGASWPLPLGNGAAARGRFVPIEILERMPLPSLVRKALDGRRTAVAVSPPRVSPPRVSPPRVSPRR